MSANEEYTLCDKDKPHELHNLVMSIFGWLAFVFQLYFALKLVVQLNHKDGSGRMRCILASLVCCGRSNGLYDTTASQQLKTATKYIILSTISVSSFSILLLIYSFGQTICYFVLIPNQRFYSIRAIGISFYCLGFVFFCLEYF